MPPNRCPHYEIFSMKKPSANNLAPKLHQVSEKALMHPKQLITVVWLSIKRWRDQKECAPTGVPISIFFKSGRRVNERRTNIIVSKTRTDNWKIRFNASLASCVSIENTHAPLLVNIFPNLSSFRIVIYPIFRVFIQKNVLFGIFLKNYPKQVNGRYNISGPLHCKHTCTI